MSDYELRRWAATHELLYPATCKGIVRLLKEKKQWQRRAGVITMPDLSDDDIALIAAAKGQMTVIPGSFEYHSPYADAPIVDAPKLVPVEFDFSEADADTADEGDALMAFFKSTNS
jgi:hypothetical protein